MMMATAPPIPPSTLVKATKTSSESRTLQTLFMLGSLASLQAQHNSYIANRMQPILQYLSQLDPNLVFWALGPAALPFLLFGWGAPIVILGIGLPLAWLAARSGLFSSA